MKPTLQIALLCLLTWVATSLSRAAEPATITSASKQFVVRGLRLADARNTLRQADLILLDPALLAVTCENVRLALQRELGWSREWAGGIFIQLHPARRDNQGILITATRASDGWQYRVDMPDEMDPPRLVRGIVEVLLMEYANRKAGERLAELPPWLAVGLAEQLQAGPQGISVLAPTPTALQTRGQIPGAGEAPLFVLAPRDPVTRTKIHGDSLASVRERLRAQAALTVDQLNWPAEDQFEATNALHYVACAHLFVHELMRLRGGVDSLREMLSLSHGYLNWQTAFLRAFEPNFQRMIDVEKWWSLTLVGFLGRDTSEVWPLADSRQRLDEVLFTPVKVRLEKDEVPHDSQISLRTLITEWEREQQGPALAQKLAQLAEICPRLDPAVSKLAEAYRAVLENYLRGAPPETAPPGGRGQFIPRDRALLSDTLASIARLDVQREKLWKLDSMPVAPKGPAGADKKSKSKSPAKEKPGKPVEAVKR